MESVKSEHFKTWHDHMTGGGIESYKNYGGSVDHAHDFVVLSRTKNSTILSNCNFLVALEALKSIDSNGVYVLSFNHWAVGWIEHLFIKPNSKALSKAEDIICALGDYPILDDSVYYDLVYTAQLDYWVDLILDKKIYYCKRAGISIFSARQSTPPNGTEEFFDIN